MTSVTGTLHDEKCILFIISRLFLRTMRTVSDKVVKKSKYILCSTIFFPKIMPFMRWCETVSLSRKGHRSK